MIIYPKLNHRKLYLLHNFRQSFRIHILSKALHQENENTTTYWNKIVAKETSDKRLPSKIYKEC